MFVYFTGNKSKVEHEIYKKNFKFLKNFRLLKKYLNGYKIQDCFKNQVLRYFT